MRLIKAAVTAGFLLSTLSAGAKPFTDQDLKRHLSSHQDGIIYIWNPLMPLSALGLKEARQLAREMKIGFVDIVDPTFGAEAGSDSLASQRLVDLGVMNHYPAVVVHRRGLLKSTVIHGYEVPEGLRVYLNTISKTKEASSAHRTSLQTFVGPQTNNFDDSSPLSPTLLKPTLVDEVKFKYLPSFFFKVSSDGAWLSLTIPTSYDQAASGGKNYLVNSKAGLVKEVPGPWDPVFNLDTDTMTLPIRGSGRDIYYGMYNFQDLVEQGPSTRPLYQDPSLKGLYQSVGVLKRSADVVKYRIIAEGAAAHAMRDYTYNKSTKDFAPAGDLKSLCPNMRIKLPMISKDGLEVGGLDMSTGTTGVFSIGINGECKKVLDLKIKTGKVNFSHDKRYLTYHVYSTTAAAVTEDFVAFPSASYTSDIFVHDRLKKKTFQLTQNERDNALYPEFLKNGQVVYAHYPRTTALGVYFRFLKADLK